MWGVEHSGGEVVDAAEGVAEFLGAVAVEAQGHGVDGEVAADEVPFEGVAKVDDGVAGDAVVLVGAEGGDFNLPAAFAGGHGAVVNSDVPHVVCAVSEDGGDGVGAGVGGEVEVDAEVAEEGIPHGAAHQVEVVAGCFEGGGQWGEGGGEGVELGLGSGHHVEGAVGLRRGSSGADRGGAGGVRRGGGGGYCEGVGGVRRGSGLLVRGMRHRVQVY